MPIAVQQQRMVRSVAVALARSRATSRGNRRNRATWRTRLDQGQFSIFVGSLPPCDRGWCGSFTPILGEVPVARLPRQLEGMTRGDVRPGRPAPAGRTSPGVVGVGGRAAHRAVEVGEPVSGPLASARLDERSNLANGCPGSWETRARSARRVSWLLKMGPFLRHGIEQEGPVRSAAGVPRRWARRRRVARRPAVRLAGQRRRRDDHERGCLVRRRASVVHWPASVSKSMDSSSEGQLGVPADVPGRR